MDYVVPSMALVLAVCLSACGAEQRTEEPEVVAPTAPAPSPSPRDPPTQAAIVGAPCHVELEYRFRDVDTDDEVWRTMRIPVTRFVPVAELDRTRYDVDWTTAPIAPAPMTAAELRAQPDATEGPPGTWHIMLADSAASYTLDPSGRTSEVDFDPIADSSVYRFHYRYDCP